ncbi:MAG: hypothetical protein SV062_07145 [Thermodesulfobacteriota bacterium]|nr:hypothetical protein [Thermodesulfobacteriota bacterium]
MPLPVQNENSYFNYLPRGNLNAYPDDFELLLNMKLKDNLKPQNNSVSASKELNNNKKFPGSFISPTQKSRQYFPQKNIDLPSQWQNSKIDNNSIISQIKTYRREQLLGNPGGDGYNIDKALNKISPLRVTKTGFTGRIYKDLTDAGKNIMNCIKNLGTGANYAYMKSDNQVEEMSKTGFLQTIKNFCRHFLRGLTFGLYPSGKGKKVEVATSHRVIQAAKNIGRAIFVDIGRDIPKCGINLVEDIALCGLNTIEVIPDATVANLPNGEKVVNEIFDDTQVLINYLADVAPTGDAWMRVHSMEISKNRFIPPIIKNLTSKERDFENDYLKTVYNSKFRKIIETIGSLTGDVLFFNYFNRTINSPSDNIDDKNNINYKQPALVKKYIKSKKRGDGRNLL